MSAPKHCQVTRKAAGPLCVLILKVPCLAQVGVGNRFEQAVFPNSGQSDGLALVYIQVLASKYCGGNRLVEEASTAGN